MNHLKAQDYYKALLIFKSKKKQSEFASWSLSHDLGLIRIMILFGSLIIFVFAIIDFYRNTNFANIVILRGSMIFILVIGFALSFSNWFYHHYNYQITALVILSCLMIELYLMDYLGHLPEFFLVNGLVTLILLTCSTLGLRFINYVMFSIATWTSYIIYSHYYFDINRTTKAPFLLSFVFTSILVSYTLEKLKLNLFTKEMALKEDHLQEINQNKLKDRLLSIISHDVKAPINSLTAILNMFNNGILNEKEFRGISKEVEKSLRQSSELLENLVRWSKLQLEDQPVIKEKINIPSLIHENCQPFLAATKYKRLTINESITNDIPPFLSDEQAIGIAFRNVLSNAIKFSPEKGTITIESWHENDGAYIRIGNNGQPLSDEEQKRLFSTAVISKKGTWQEVGTGLGLNLSKELMIKLGGDLHYSHTKECNSCFTMFIPIT